MNLFDSLLEDQRPGSRAGRISGVVTGVVTNNQDPEGLGRVKVRFPFLSDEDESQWARVAAPMRSSPSRASFWACASPVRACCRRVAASWAASEPQVNTVTRVMRQMLVRRIVLEDVGCQVSGAGCHGWLLTPNT